MRIGFDAKRAVSNFTGLGNYSRFVISNMMQYYPGNEYRLFIPKLPSGNYSETIENEEIYYSLKNTRKPFWRTMGIVKDIKREKIDLYHGLSNELPYHINNSGAKSILTIHDLIFLRYPQFYNRIDRTIYNIKARYACKVADKIVAVSECSKRDIISYYDTDPSRIEVVYQGCFPIFKEEITGLKKDEVRKKYNLPDNYLISVGSIEDRKNILLIVKALRQIPDIHFYAIGKKREYARIVQQYATDNGLADRVHMISDVPLTDLPAMMHLAKIFIYPSLYEGFGIPVIEAMNSGTPVIAATGSCLEEAGGPDSVYVDPHDEDELAHHIRRLLDDNALRTDMVSKGKEYVKRFSDEACTEAMMSVYQSLF